MQKDGLGNPQRFESSTQPEVQNLELPTTVEGLLVTLSTRSSVAITRKSAGRTHRIAGSWGYRQGLSLRV